MTDEQLKQIVTKYNNNPTEINSELDRLFEEESNYQEWETKEKPKKPAEKKKVREMKLKKYRRKII